MRTLWAALALLCVTGPRAMAQDCCTDKAELYFGYSYVNSSPGVAAPFGKAFASNFGRSGVGAGLTYNLKTWAGVSADFSWHPKGFSLNGANSSSSSLLFLFGPRFSVRNEGFVLFGEAKAGVQRNTFDFGLAAPVTGSSRSNLAFGFGGGAEILAGKRFAIRVFQFDFLPIRGVSSGANPASEWSLNYRIQGGVCFRLPSSQ